MPPGARGAANSPKPPTTTTRRNPRSAGPTADWVNEWTEATTPERVRKVPRMVSEKVPMIRATFHAWSIPRRRCTTAEWMKAVAVSQGRNEAFSTGSQAQNPPQPRTSYDHQPPSTMPSERNDQATRVQRRVRSSHAVVPSPETRAAMAKANGTVIPTYPR